jgi:hypothetical protein
MTLLRKKLAQQACATEAVVERVRWCLLGRVWAERVSGRCCLALVGETNRVDLVMLQFVGRAQQHRRENTQPKQECDDCFFLIVSRSEVGWLKVGIAVLLLGQLPGIQLRLLGRDFGIDRIDQHLRPTR